MKQRPTVHFSNCLEELAEALGRELFKKGNDPFKEKLVLLPSHSLKLYLSSFFASHPKWSICAGITFKTLLDGALHLLPKDREFIFPSSLTLSFAIQKELDWIEQHEIDQPIFAELKEYLGSIEESEQKRIWISEELSRLFYEYSTFEGSSLQKWIKKGGWKQILWDRIFNKSFSWSVFSKTLQTEKNANQTAHLFGFSHLPSTLYHFFSGGGSHIYFLSPSTAFWEDVCSDKERIFLEKKMEGKKVCLKVRDQLTFFLKDTHPLLANWGKVGRSLLRQLGNTESYMEEEYIDPSLREFSLLTCLQESLFLLEEEKKAIPPGDTSILCLSSTSKLREVEVLFETLQESLLLHTRVELKDILVLVPDLEAYLPYIQMVFGGEGESIGYSVHGLSSRYSSEEARAIDSFFSLAETRFDRDSVLKFLGCPLIMKKFKIKADEFNRIEQWLKEAHILWGLDPNHKIESINDSWPKDSFKGDFSLEGSWEEGINRLLKGLAMDFEPFIGTLHPEEIESPWPLPCIDWTDAELLGTLAHFLSCLKEDLKPICKKERKTFSEWVFLVEKWLSFYFEEIEIGMSLVKHLKTLLKEFGQNTPSALSFFSFKRAISAFFENKKESFHSSHLNTVKFLPMELGSSYPSEIIAILGADEGSFPRTKPISCFDESKGLKETPSITEQDRYLFLELILHARKQLIISYQRMSWKDQKNQNSSLLVQELINYLHKQYSYEIRRDHPSMSFDQKYFQKEVKSYSPFSFLLAKSYYLEKKRKVDPFFSSWHEKKNGILDSIPKRIEIKKIQEFAKDPIRFYLKEKLGIFFEFVAPREEEFYLAASSKARIKQEAFQKGIDFALGRARARGELPLGKIGKIACDDLEADFDNWRESLSSFGLEEKDIFSLELTETAFKTEIYPRRRLMPALSVDIEGAGSVLLVGDLYPVSDKGFLWTGNSSKAYSMRWYPLSLIFACLSKTSAISADCLLLETGKTFSLPVLDPIKQLSRYLRLFLRALQEPCPIRPDWAFDFLCKTKEEVEKKRKASFYGKIFEDPYEKWISKRESFPELEILYRDWKENWDEVFSPLLGEIHDEL